MRRWNGWGDEANHMDLPDSAGQFLAQLLGKAQPLEDVSLDFVCQQVPVSRLPEHKLINTDNEGRVRHARGQSLPDWLAMRSGQFNVFPDGVAYPENNQDVKTLLSLAKTHHFDLIPYGGGTSVAGHITPNKSERAILTVDMNRMNQLLDLDEDSQIATFGAGTAGPLVEAQLRAKGYTLGHFPQSFELSTIGGWVASRSSGQQSLRYGRIEQLFAGGSLETFAGTMEIATFPASSAGPDLREIILGCEGRFGILTDVKVRVTRIAEAENFFVTFFENWEAAKSFCRDAAQQRIPLSMLRVSNAVETQTQLKLAGHASAIVWLERYLKLRGCGDEKCMLTFGITGSKAQYRSTSKQINRLARQYKGVNTGTTLGKRWLGNRFKLPYLREALWLQGYAIDTLETATDWKNVNMLQNKVEASLREGLADENEPVHVFTHLSHVYSQGCSLYTSYLYRCADTYEETHARWKKLKVAASETIANNHGTISHQHGVGKDHAPYLKAEKGEQGMAVLSALCDHFDADKQLNPGTLIED